MDKLREAVSILQKEHDSVMFNDGAYPGVKSALGVALDTMKSVLAARDLRIKELEEELRKIENDGGQIGGDACSEIARQAREG